MASGWGGLYPCCSGHLPHVLSAIFLPLIQASGPVPISRTSPTRQRGAHLCPILPRVSTCFIHTHFLRQSPARRMPTSSGLHAAPLTCCVTLSKSLLLWSLLFPSVRVGHQVAEGAVAYSDVCCSCQLLLRDKVSQTSRLMPPVISLLISLRFGWGQLGAIHVAFVEALWGQIARGSLTYTSGP